MNGPLRSQRSQYRDPRVDLPLPFRVDLPFASPGHSSIIHGVEPGAVDADNCFLVEKLPQENDGKLLPLDEAAFAVALHSHSLHPLVLEVHFLPQYLSHMAILDVQLLVLDDRV